MTQVHTLTARWREDAQAFERCGHEHEARRLRARADEVDAAVQATSADVLTLADASALSGYSAAYLARLIRDGRLPNAGRPNAPRVRRADLPRKARCLTTEEPVCGLPPTREQIARSIATRTRK